MPRRDYEILSVHFSCKKVKVKYMTPDNKRDELSVKFQNIPILEDYVKEGMELLKALIRDRDE
jgi:hypothetical protein